MGGSNCSRVNRICEHFVPNMKEELMTPIVIPGVRLFRFQAHALGDMYGMHVSRGVYVYLLEMRIGLPEMGPRTGLFPASDLFHLRFRKV